MARVLIVGCGDIGSSLGLRLAARGNDVWGLRRQPRLVPPPLRAIGADLADPESKPELPADLDHIWIITTADRFAEEAYRRAYLEVARSVGRLAGETQAGLKRIFFVSSTSVYGQTSGVWVDEESPATAGRFPGRILRQAEVEMEKSGLPVTTIRPAGIYGPGRSRTVDRVRSGKATLAPEPRYLNLIHRNDLISALEHLGSLEQPDPLYLAVDHQPVDRNELLLWLARRLGAPPPPVGSGEDGRRRSSSKRCRNRLLLSTGFRFRYPTYREGYRALLDG